MTTNYGLAPGTRVWLRPGLDGRLLIGTVLEPLTRGQRFTRFAAEAQNATWYWVELDSGTVEFFRADRLEVMR